MTTSLKDLIKEENKVLAPLEARFRSESNPEARRKLREQIEQARLEFRKKLQQTDYSQFLKTHDVRNVEKSFAIARGFRWLWVFGALVVLAVIAAGLIVYHRNAQTIADGSEVKVFVNKAILTRNAEAIVAFRAQFGRWPTSLGELARPPRETPFLVDVPTDGVIRDAWGFPLIYFPYDARTDSGKILSVGKDGRLDGTGYDRDTEVRFNEKGVIEQ